MSNHNSVGDQSWRGAGGGWIERTKAFKSIDQLALEAKRTAEAKKNVSEPTKPAARLPAASGSNAGVAAPK